MNSDQLEGPGMPGAGPPVQNLTIPTVSTPVDQQPDSTTETYGGEDEEERKYCYCERVSYGEMIGCDDLQCEREWVRIFLNFLRSALMLMM